MTAPHRPPVLLHALKLIRAGRRDEAARACRARLDEHPDDVDALQLLGVVAGMSGDFAEARRLLERANALRPGHPDILDNLAHACRESGAVAEARRWSETAVAAAPTRAPSWYGLAVSQRRLGDWHGALASYRRVVELEPAHADAWANLASVAESLNLLTESNEAAQKALALAPANVMANLAAAQVALRRDAPGDARDRLSRLLQAKALAPNHRAIAHQRLGVALDRLGDCAAAFEEFAAANRVLADAGGTALRDGRGPLGLPAVRRLRRYVEAYAPGTGPAPAPVDGDPPPVFLMGFPRSGTTLTERILDAHPRFATLEERDTLVDLQRDFVLPPDGLDRLARLDQPTRQDYRDAYRRRVAAWMEPAPAVTVVDKLPLHSVSLPLISGIFPDARVVFVIRDPRDVCLSCFMQTFELNEAMAHFLDLELTADYYAAVMDLALASLERLPIASLMVRYEALVDDPETACRSLIDFLGADWDPAVLRWHEDQGGRQIETPSYRQVAQPMYRSAVGRWRRYETELAPVLERLAPIAARLGYD